MSFSWNLGAKDDAPGRVDNGKSVPTGLEFLGLDTHAAAPRTGPSESFATRRDLRAAALVKPARTKKTAHTRKSAPAAVRERTPKASDRPSKALARSAKRVGRSTKPVARSAKQQSRSTNPSSGSPRKRSFRRHVLPKIVSIGAMLGVGAFLVATSVPANALMNGSVAAATSTSRVESQSLEAVNKNVVVSTGARDGYTVATIIDLARAANVPSKWLYTNDPNGTIQWPFQVQVPIAQGFGPKTSSCFYCNAFHQGVDFDGGNGSPIGAIAAGVVSNVTLGHSGLGNNITIDHVINGQNVQSVYAHMMDGTVKVTVGETVKTAQVIGQVGATGEATGPHLHLEVHLNGVPIDPFAWLKANAN